MVILLPIIGIISKLEFEISYLLNFFNSKYNIKIIYITFLQAFLSAIFSCIIAIPFALSLYRHKNSRIIKLIVSLCGYSFVTPSILIVYSVIGIYGINLGLGEDPDSEQIHLISESVVNGNIVASRNFGFPFYEIPASYLIHKFDEAYRFQVLAN